jgi:mRNA interferase HigB
MWGIMNSLHPFTRGEAFSANVRRHEKAPEQDDGKYKDAANKIERWKAIAKEARWHHFEEVRSVLKDADEGDGHVIFDSRNNRYRLVTLIYHAKTTKKKRTMGHVSIRSFLTHKE